MIDRTLHFPIVQASVRHLSQQYHWQLLSEDAWVTAALVTLDDLINEKSARRACLTIYAQELYRSCQEPARREQAYRELYDYLWPQAHYRIPQFANEAAQLAIELVFRSFQEPQLATCAEPKAFLAFAQAKLRDAIGRVKHQHYQKNEILEFFADPSDGLNDPLDQLRDPNLTPEEKVLEDEANKERAYWQAAAIQRIALQVLTCLEQLWIQARLHRQLEAIIFTFMDRIGDWEIASRLATAQKNIEVLRSRGLDKLRKCLYQRLIADGGS